jgi:hypothetical protein
MAAALVYVYCESSGGWRFLTIGRVCQKCAVWWGCGVVECELHVTCSIILIVIQLILIFSIVYSIFFSEVVCVYVMREP